VPLVWTELTVWTALTVSPVSTVATAPKENSDLRAYPEMTVLMVLTDKMESPEKREKLELKVCPAPSTTAARETPENPVWMVCPDPLELRE